MKKILVLNRSINQGGIDDVGLEVAKYLAKKYEVCLAVFFNPHKLSIPQVKVVTLGIGPAETKIKKLTNLYKRFFGIRKVRREFKPDLIIAQGNQPDILVALDKFLFGSYKTIFTVHNIFSRDLSGSERFIFKLIANQPSAWVAVSTQVEEDFRNNFGAKKMQFITNPVRALEKNNENVTGKFLFSAGRLEKQKDFWTLIKAFSLVSKKVPGLKLIIAGTGSYQEDLESLTRSLGLEEKVIFTGHIPNIYAYVKNCEMFVSSSIYEGTPITVLQALDLGKAIVATDVPGTKFAAGEAGIYSATGDEHALASNIEKVLTDKTLKAALEKNATLQAKKFSIDVLGKEWEKLVEEVLK